MADLDYDDWDAPAGDLSAAAPRGGLVPRVVNGAGALTSVALVVGLGVWGYQLAVRDVTGIPVIRALAGQARIAPENPGGDLAQHQGLAVNAIAAVGEAAPAADRLMLAPASSELTEADQPMESLVVSAAPTEGGTDAGAASVLSAPATGPAPILAALGMPREPLPDGVTEPLDTLAGEEGAIGVVPTLEILPADVPGVSASLRPAARPVGDAIAEAAAAAVAMAMAPEVGLDVDPADLAPGTRLVQLGAYSDEAEAKLEWDKVAARVGALMEGKQRVIQTAESGGMTFYRLRVEGFADLADARRFCAALKAENTECVPAQVR